MEKNDRTQEKEQVALEFRHVTGHGKGFVVQEINFALKQGYCMALTGRNGAGKTTLIRMILDSDESYRGEILVYGKTLKQNHNACMEEIGYISGENTFFQGLTAYENCYLYEPLYENWDQEKFIHNMEELNVNGNSRICEYSKGEFLRFQLAFARAHGAKIYLMDEVTAGLDPIFRRDFWKLIGQWIAEENSTVLFTSHIQSELEFRADYIGRLERGRMMEFGEAKEQR